MSTDSTDSTDVGLEAVRPRRIPLFEVAEIVRNWPTAAGYGPYISWSWGVPLATARRWVYEARRAGLLEPGTTGRPCPACNGTGVTRWQNGTPRPKGRTSERQAS